MATNPPKYRYHAASGQAIVTLTDCRTKRRKDVYLGEYGTPESRTRYANVTAQWEDAGRILDMPAKTARYTAAPRVGVVAVSNVALAYWHHMQTRYTGRRNKARLLHVKATIRLWRSLYGGLPASEFGPLALRHVRDEMIAAGWSRKTVNDRVRIIQAAYGHAVSVELAKADKFVALQSVKPLRRGEGGVEGAKVLPVPATNINKVKDHVAPQVWALIQLQLLTGARAGELVIMRAIDLDTTGNVWLYRPQFHKGDDDETRERIIYLGPKAQEVIKPYLPTSMDRPLDGYLFSAREANAARKATRARKGKPRRSNQKSNPRKTDRRTGNRYSTGSYRKAIARGCLAAKIDVWTPHRLRHNAATNLRREFGVEAAAIILGHSDATITGQIYAERDHDKARDIIGKVG